MPKVNFLSQGYRCEPVKSDAILGICDPEGEKSAYTTTDASGNDKWVATIQNDQRIGVAFVPVDKNIPICRANGEKESSCDGMILYEKKTIDGVGALLSKNIAFIELKDVRVGGWLSGAISQLGTTIQVFNENHNFRDFDKRQAYAANCKHPQFQTSCREQLQEFKSKYHFTLIPKATVTIE